jgi:hypothetical protein
MSDRALLLTLFDTLMNNLRRLPGETDTDRVMESLMDAAVGQLVLFQNWTDLPATHGEEVQDRISDLCAELAALHESWQQPEPSALPQPSFQQRDPWLDYMPNPLLDPAKYGLGPPHPPRPPPAPPTSAPVPASEPARPPRPGLGVPIDVRPSYGRSGRG